MSEDVAIYQSGAGLKRLREPFAANQISKLPKPMSKDAKKGNCRECGGYHGLPAVHLKYVGHAALTDRLLDADPAWTWEPLAYGPDGLPLIDAAGGMWIRLTVCGVTRLGYGDAQGKTGGDAIKERIGDALRNAAMRFGAALDLWHKGDLHLDNEREAEDMPAERNVTPPPNSVPLDIPTPTAPGYDSSNLILKSIPFVESAANEYKYVRRADAPSVAGPPQPERRMWVFAADGSEDSSHATMGAWLDALDALLAETDRTLASTVLAQNAPVLQKIKARGGFDDRVGRIYAAMDAAMDAATVAQQGDENGL